MADYGAEVIKVEPPGGDPFRFQPAWISWNRGKQGIVLDLSTTAGREQAIQLAGAADVLVESYPIVRAREKSGLSQSQFAALLGVSVRTLQEWEQGRREPSAAAKTLIKVAELNPAVLRKIAA